MIAPSTLRLLQVLSAVNVLLAVAVIGVRIFEGATVLSLLPQACFGLGFAAIFRSCSREMKLAGSGRPWMLLGGLLLAAASVIHLLS